MIELTVSKTSDSPSVFSISPQSINLGGKQASGVDFLRVSVPPDWQGKTVRITFVHAANNQKVAVILPETGIIKLTSDITSCSGDIVIDAAGTDNYAAYSTGCHYMVYSHPDAGSNGQVITPDEYHQFVGEVKNYSDLAQTNATAAGESKSAALSSEQNAKNSETASLAAQQAASDSATSAQSSANTATSAKEQAEASANKAIEYTTIFQNSGYHNSIYRGKDISSNEADGSMYTNIADGTFNDIFVGDYFTKMINGTNYVLRVAGCDSYLNRGDTALTAHHIVVVPDTAWSTCPISNTGSIDGGYVSSQMYTDTLPLWAGYLTTAFGTHLLTLRELLVNAISSTTPSGWALFDSKVGLMTSEEVAGCGAFGVFSSGYSFNIGIAYGQLPLFRLSPDRICIRHMYWLRNIVNSATFAVIDASGNLERNNVANSQWLRPKFLLG